MKSADLLHAVPFALLLLTAGTANAAPAIDPAPALLTRNSMEMERQVMHQIDRHVIFPLSDRSDAMLGTVEVAFVVNTEGRVVVTSASSKNKELCDYVVAKLGGIRIGPNPSGLWKTSHVQFTFRPE